MAGAIRLEKAEFAVRTKTDKTTGRKLVIPTMEIVIEGEGNRTKKKLTLYRKANTTVWVPSQKVLRPSENSTAWSYSYDARDAVSYLIYGTTTVRPSSMESKTHFNHAADRLSHEIRIKIRRFAKRKDLQEALETAGKKDERLNLMGELETSLDKLVRKFPGIRKQDVLLAFERAREKETVRQVMET